MSLQALTTWVGVAGKAISNFDDSELFKLASMIAGDNATSVLDILKKIRENEPETTAQTLLKSDTMKAVFERFVKADTGDDSIFCRCPVCETTFEQPTYKE